MLVRTHGFAIQRGIAEHVIVELDVRAGLPSFSVIGLAGGAARDARERVQAAVLNCGLAVPRRRVTVNLAPASSRRSGSEFDLAIACCVVAADGLIDPARLARTGLFGELGLGGLLRACEAPAAAAEAAGEARLERLIVARADVEEARSAGALPIAGMGDLGAVVAMLAGRATTLDARRRGVPAAPHGNPVGPSDAAMAHLGERTAAHDAHAQRARMPAPHAAGENARPLAARRGISERERPP